MREITKEVEDGTYDKPMGRGVLRIRSWEMNEGETKHILELGGGHFAYVRRYGNSALIADADVPNAELPLLAGMADLLDVDDVFIYTHNDELELHTKLGCVWRSVRMYKEGGYELPRPEGLEIDTVLSEPEREKLFSMAERFPQMKIFVRQVGQGTAMVNRLPSPHGDVLLFTTQLGDPQAITLAGCHANSGQDLVRALDAFNYLTGQYAYGCYTDEVEDGELTDQLKYLSTLGFTIQSYIYSIPRTPKGENHAN